MERALGINPGSPIFDSPQEKPKKPKLCRRSSRRTTMLAPDLNQSLSEFRKSMLHPVVDSSRRRSVRIAKKDEKSETTMRHPLDVKEHWKVDEQKQREHNEGVLRILNTGNMKILQALPAIGPKSAMMLHSHR